MTLVASGTVKVITTTGDSAAGYSCGSEEGVISRINPDGGNDASSLDVTSHLMFLHRVVSVQRRKSPMLADARRGEIRPRQFSIHLHFAVRVSVSCVH